VTKACTPNLVAVRYRYIADKDQHILKSISDLVSKLSVHMKECIMAKEERDRKPKLVECTERHF
jgi:negative regulator of replication initiation